MELEIAVKVMKNKVKLKTCPRLQETKRTKELNAMFDPGLNPGTKNDIKGKLVRSLVG